MYWCVLMCPAHSMSSHAMSMPHSCDIHPPNDDVLMSADVHCTFNVVPCNVHATFMPHSSTTKRRCTDACWCVLHSQCRPMQCPCHMHSCHTTSSNDVFWCVLMYWCLLMCTDVFWRVLTVCWFVLSLLCADYMFAMCVTCKKQDLHTSRGCVLLSATNMRRAKSNNLEDVTFAFSCKQQICGVRKYEITKIHWSGFY